MNYAQSEPLINLNCNIFTSSVMKLSQNMIPTTYQAKNKITFHQNRELFRRLNGECKVVVLDNNCLSLINKFCFGQASL